MPHSMVQPTSKHQRAISLLLLANTQLLKLYFGSSARMQVLQHSETFQRRFNLPPASHAQEAPKRKGKSRRSATRQLLWWTALAAVSIFPSWAVVATDLPSAWQKIDAAVQETLDFPKAHKIRIPLAAQAQVDARFSFEDTNADLIAWHKDMSRLQKQIAEQTPIGTVQDSTLEFVFQAPLAAKSPAREWRAAAVSLYFVLSASLYFFDSLHIAIILLQFNVLEFSLAIKIKQLDDALEKTLDHLVARHMELAMLPLEMEPSAIGQQLLCLQKMELFYNVWNQVNLGQNIRIPFRKDFVNLNLSLVFSIVAAVLLRSLEVILLSVWPNLPRFNLSKRLYAWIRRSIPGSRLTEARSGDASLYNAPIDLTHEPSQPTSLDLLFRQQSQGAGPSGIQQTNQDAHLAAKEPARRPSFAPDGMPLQSVFQQVVESSGPIRNAGSDPGREVDCLTQRTTTLANVQTDVAEHDRKTR